MKYFFTIGASLVPVDQRVADGKLTQDQAAQVMERIKTQVAASVSRTATGPNRPADGLGRGMGMGMGRGGNGGGYGGNCPYID